MRMSFKRLSVAFSCLRKDMDISAKELNRQLTEISKVESSCAADGERLGLQKVVRVSFKTNSTTPPIVCGAFRALFGAIAVDAGSSDDAGRFFLKFHSRDAGKALLSSF